MSNLIHNRRVCSLREYFGADNNSLFNLCSLSSASPLLLRPAGLVHQRLDGEYHILWDRGEETPLVPCDGIARHAKPRGEFLLGETEVEPLTAKPPTGQLPARYLREHALSIDLAC